MTPYEFYHSKKWRNKRNSILRRDKYLCQECRKYGRFRTATCVHHIKHYEDYPELAFDNKNLESLCNQCHNKKHPEKGKKGSGFSSPLPFHFDLLKYFMAGCTFSNRAKFKKFFRKVEKVPESKAISKKSAKALTIRSMKKLGVYKKEYDKIIDIYAELMEQYEILSQQFEENGRKCISATADGGEKKSPLVATLENLRKDILQYSDRLMLNPKAISQSKTIKEENGQSLAEVLKEIGKKQS